MSSSAAASSPRREKTPEDAIREAEAAVAALTESFVAWIGEDIARARTALSAATSSPGDNLAELRTIFEVMHNVKGQGGSFGYDLLTRIGGSLCDYIREAAVAADENQLRVIEAHFAAMDFILGKEIQGNGGEVGERLVARLDSLVASVPGPS